MIYLKDTVVSQDHWGLMSREPVWTFMAGEHSQSLYCKLDFAVAIFIFKKQVSRLQVSRYYYCIFSK